MVLWLLSASKENAESMAREIHQLKNNLRFCSICNHITEDEICRVCRDPGRDKTTICVVESPKDLIAIERTGTYKGQYHVLLGAIAPMEGRGPDDLQIHLLVNKVQSQGIKEVVIATDPDTEGEMTALHIANELKSTGVKLTRIGFGIPVGSSLEYADLSTLTMSLTARREL